MTRAFITGGTGFVASHLQDFLLAHTDWEIHTLIRPRSSLDNIEHLLERINNKDRLYLHYGDLNDMGSLISALHHEPPDYVFHLAAQSFPKTSFNSPQETLETNILGTCRLLEAIRYEAPLAKIHVCASSEVFGRVPQEKLPIDEDCSFHPASPYAISKVGTDLLGRYYAEALGLHVQTTRMFTHTGPRRGDVFAESSFAKQIAMIEAGLIPPVIKVGNLNSMRTWADVRDAVRAYYMLLTVNPVKGGFYNIGGNYSCTVFNMLQTLLKMSPMCNRIQFQEDPERLRPIDADNQVPSCKKFTEHTGWKPEIPFEQTMSDLLEFWRNKVKRGGAFLQR